MLLAALVSLSASASADPGLVGEWDLTIDTGRSVQEQTLSITRLSSGELGGAVRGSANSTDIHAVTVGTERFSFYVPIIVRRNQAGVLHYTGSRNGDSVSGNVETPRGSMSFTGVRVAE